MAVIPETTTTGPTTLTYDVISLLTSWSSSDARSVPADEKLKSVRTQFIERVTDSNLNTLLGKLLEQGIINDGEREFAGNLNRAKKAEALIDMVRKKGAEASSALITALCEVDPFLSKLLNLQ
ncbi:uncharacterized protein LOC121888132 [Scomber scombrus]|uniref:Uncharacterized protein LOC121888132 n=1 Tax=Scomber scombrus TaxID=13677 RepID=A0AAV1QI68_SCOSC